MKISCNGNDLSLAVGQVFKAVSSKTTMPILEGILLKAERGALTLTATDLELSIEKSIAADVKIEGETVVPGRFFAEFVKKLTHEQIELSLIDSRLKIRYGDSEGVLQCYNSAEFPPVKELIGAQKFTLQRSELKDLINKISFAVSPDDSRPILKGVLFEVSDKTLTGVALDGYRLAKCVKELISTTAMMTATVPGRCLNELARLLDDSPEPVEILIQKNYLMVNLDHIKVTSRLLDGDFFNYRQIIPQNFESLVTIPREIFEDGLERAILLAKSEKNNLVKFDIKDNLLKLESNSEIGNIVEKIPVAISGVDITIAFNARYFTEIMRYVTCDHIVIKFINSFSPCVVAPASGSDDFMYLILPVRMT